MIYTNKIYRLKRSCAGILKENSYILVLSVVENEYQKNDESLRFICSILNLNNLKRYSQWYWGNHNWPFYFEEIK
jgi:hypothetical protein